MWRKVVKRKAQGTGVCRKLVCHDVWTPKHAASSVRQRNQGNNKETGEAVLFGLRWQIARGEIYCWILS